MYVYMCVQVLIVSTVNSMIYAQTDWIVDVSGSTESGLGLTIEQVSWTGELDRSGLIIETVAQQLLLCHFMDLDPSLCQLLICQSGLSIICHCQL